jgi:hypothetical protein
LHLPCRKGLHILPPCAQHACSSVCAACANCRTHMFHSSTACKITKSNLFMTGRWELRAGHAYMWNVSCKEPEEPRRLRCFLHAPVMHA